MILPKGFIFEGGSIRSRWIWFKHNGRVIRVYNWKSHCQLTKIRSIPCLVTNPSLGLLIHLYLLPFKLTSISSLVSKKSLNKDILIGSTGLVPSFSVVDHFIKITHKAPWSSSRWFEPRQLLPKGFPLSKSRVSIDSKVWPDLLSCNAT